jgi:hypothetical protein
MRRRPERNSALGTRLEERDHLSVHLRLPNVPGSPTRRTGVAASAIEPTWTKLSVYLCGPQSPWQHGSNEITNGLLREYFPKGTNLAVHSQERLDEVARQLNGRQRKTLGFETPAEPSEACVATTD